MSQIEITTTDTLLLRCLLDGEDRITHSNPWSVDETKDYETLIQKGLVTVTCGHKQNIYRLTDMGKTVAILALEKYEGMEC